MYGVLNMPIVRVNCHLGSLNGAPRAAFAAFAGMLFGYDSGYISSVMGMDAFKKQYG